MDGKFRVLHLTVLVEGIDQLCQRLRFPLNSPQISLELLRRHLTVTYGINISRNDCDRRFQIVGNVSDQFLTSLIQQATLPFTLCQLL